jgi:hypothetical protein
MRGHSQLGTLTCERSSLGSLSPPKIETSSPMAGEASFAPMQIRPSLSLSSCGRRCGAVERGRGWEELLREEEESGVHKWKFTLNGTKWYPEYHPNHCTRAQKILYNNIHSVNAILHCGENNIHRQWNSLSWFFLTGHNKVPFSDLMLGQNNFIYLPALAVRAYLKNKRSSVPWHMQR